MFAPPISQIYISTRQKSSKREQTMGYKSWPAPPLIILWLHHWTSATGTNDTEKASSGGGLGRWLRERFVDDDGAGNDKTVAHVRSSAVRRGRRRRFGPQRSGRQRFGQPAQCWRLLSFNPARVRQTLPPMIAKRGATRGDLVADRRAPPGTV
jgi:hypothetical protein